MERPAEPRFPINSHVTVTVLRNPERTVACRLLDISATGMGLVSHDRMLEGEVIELSVLDHSVLARIRHSHRRGDAYVIGAERIEAVPTNSSAAERPTLPGPPAPEVERASQVTSTLVPELTSNPQLLSIPISSFSEPRSWRIPVTLVASFAIAAVVLMNFLQFHWPVRAASWRQSSDAQTAQVRQTASVVTGITGEATSLPLPAPVPFTTGPNSVRALPAAGSGASRVEVKVLETTWVAATADGKEAFAKLLTKGETREFEFSRIAFLHIGDAAGVEIRLDGKPVGSLGHPAQLRLIQLTPVGMQFLPWSNRDPVINTNQ